MAVVSKEQSGSLPACFFVRGLGGTHSPGRRMGQMGKSSILQHSHDRSRRLSLQLSVVVR